MGKLRVAKGWATINNGECIIQIGQRNYPKTIYFIRGEKYDVYELKSRTAYQKLLTKDIEMTIDNVLDGYGFEDALPKFQVVWKDIDEMDLEDIVHDSSKVRHLKMAYPVYKGSEIVSKINKGNFEDTDIPYDLIKKKHLGIDKQKLHNFVVLKSKVPYNLFVEFFGAIDLEESEFVETYKFKGWNIIIEKRTKVDYDEMRELLTTVYKHLRKLGLGNLAYGKITAVNTLKGNAIADYQPMMDEMRLQTKGMKVNRDAVRDVLHELGHRYFYRKMDKQTRSEVESKFRRLGYNQISWWNYDLKMHDILKSDDETYELIRKDRRGWIAEMIDTTNNRKKRSVGNRYVLRVEGLATGDLEIVNRDIDLSDDDSSEYFVTSYSRKNYEEFFCELFSFWAMGDSKLKGNALDWFEGIMS